MERDLVEEERFKLLQIVSEMLPKAPREAQDLYRIVIAELSSMLINPSCSEFVSNYIRTEKVDIRPDGVFVDGVLVRNPKAFFHTLHQRYKLYKRERNFKSNISLDEISLEFDAILEEQWREKQTDLRTKLAFIDDRTKWDKMLHEFIIALAGHQCDMGSVTFRLYKAFLAHWLWGVMRKLNFGAQSVLRSGNQSVLMLVSTQQKTGKSTTCRILVSPFEDAGFVWRTNFARLNDNFSLSNLAYNYIAWYDDADRDSSLNMGKFKQIVTDDLVSYRVMFRQQEMRVPKLSSFLGTSNKSARELMHDSSGLRRFHQIFVNNESVDTGRGIDLDYMSTMNMELLYRLTPIGEESPIFDFITPQELSQYEDEIRPRHIIEEWISEDGLQPAPPETPESDRELLKLEAMYGEFSLWAGGHGYDKKYTPNAISFGHKLAELGFERGRNSQFRGFWVLKV